MLLLKEDLFQDEFSLMDGSSFWDPEPEMKHDPVGTSQVKILSVFTSLPSLSSFVSFFVGNRLLSASWTFPEFQRADSNSC